MTGRHFVGDDGKSVDARELFHHARHADLRLTPATTLAGRKRPASLKSPGERAP